MNNWKDNEKFYCASCGQTWELVSDNIITIKQHNEWLLRAVKQHNSQCKNQLKTKKLKGGIDEDTFNQGFGYSY